MTWDKTPWAVGGGAELSPEMLRATVYGATSGSEGIVLPTDLKVSASAVPSGTLQVSPGAMLALNRHASGTQQTYVARNPTIDTVDIAPTTSSGGRTDLVIARVEDPQYDPWPAPADPVAAQYVFTRVIQNVPADTRSARELGLGYPAIALARIAIPPSTAAITNAMITDLRRVAMPRTDREIEVGLPATTRATPANPGGVNNTWYQMWPIQNIEVPHWATTMIVTCTVSGLELLNGNFFGLLRVNFFNQVTQNVTLDLNWTGNPDRSTHVVGGRINIPANFRGAISSGALDGQRTSGTGRIETDSGSTITTDLTFQERAS